MICTKWAQITRCPSSPLGHQRCPPPFQRLPRNRRNHQLPANARAGRMFLHMPSRPDRGLHQPAGRGWLEGVKLSVNLSWKTGQLCAALHDISQAAVQRHMITQLQRHSAASHGPQRIAMLRVWGVRALDPRVSIRNNQRKHI